MLFTSTYLFMLLMKDLCNVVLHCSELLIDVMQKLVEVRSIELTALYQHLQGQ